MSFADRAPTELHSQKIIIGDINGTNLPCNPAGEFALLDCDGWQFQHDSIVHPAQYATRRYISRSLLRRYRGNPPCNKFSGYPNSHTAAIGLPTPRAGARSLRAQCFAPPRRRTVPQERPMNTAAEFVDHDFAQLPKGVSESLDCNDAYRASTKKLGIPPIIASSRAAWGIFRHRKKLTHSAGLWSKCYEFRRICPFNSNISFIIYPKRSVFRQNRPLDKPSPHHYIPLPSSLQPGARIALPPAKPHTGAFRFNA